MKKFINTEGLATTTDLVFGPFNRPQHICFGSFSHCSQGLNVLLLKWKPSSFTGKKDSLLKSSFDNDKFCV